jgi:putative phosphoribosyl transferase
MPKTPVAEHPLTLPRPVRIQIGNGLISGDLTVPADVSGIVIFAHGSGSGRLSPRNRAVADVMVKAGLATLLVDLLTEAEARIDEVTAELRFDIPFLTERVTSSIDWASQQQQTSGLQIGLFGASTGAAAALMSAAERPRRVRAVVSRGGRPDLAESALEIVTAPTLLIVGGRDREVIALNQQALDRLTTVRRLEIVSGATHLFEEPGTLDAVARLATDWFLQYLPARP